jgi:hypothetical protein
VVKRSLKKPIEFEIIEFDLEDIVIPEDVDGIPIQDDSSTR